MTTATLTRPEVVVALAVAETAVAPVKLTTAQIVARNRASVPHITCEACGTYTARSNSHADEICDLCIDRVHPAHALYTSHGVAWREHG